MPPKNLMNVIFGDAGLEDDFGLGCVGWSCGFGGWRRAALEGGVGVAVERCAFLAQGFRWRGTV